MAATTTTTTTTKASSEIHRFVPQGEASLVDDAPGWEDSDGPTCWKCKGVGTKGMPKQKKPRNKKRKKASDVKEEIAGSSDTVVDKKDDVLLSPPPTRRQMCPVCQGRGHLLKRQVPELMARITRGRKRTPEGWRPSGPMPAAAQTDTKWYKLVHQANEEHVDVEISEAATDESGRRPPSWLPQRRGEELCNLVGTWRILQRVGSHRWTTDDLVTAWVASDTHQQQQQQKEGGNNNNKNEALNYLDLGTGNGSVLQMVTWALLKDGYCHTKAIGVEARSEAVALARRSLSFNVGTTSKDDNAVACIVHGDFRDVRINDRQFDIVTGTPPYFRVDFDVNKQGDKGVVSKAIINQGGMPTAKQSAPARCEFRGGIEAYCEAAARVLKPTTGRFIVCENWLNHDRVVASAKACQLHIIKQVEVMGKEGKANLFAVYVMKKCSATGAETSAVPTVAQPLAVRTTTGDWTNDYKELVLKTMSIPFA